MILTISTLHYFVHACTQQSLPNYTVKCTHTRINSKNTTNQLVLSPKKANQPHEQLCTSIHFTKIQMALEHQSLHRTTAAEMCNTIIQKLLLAPQQANITFNFVLWRKGLGTCLLAHCKYPSTSFGHSCLAQWWCRPCVAVAPHPPEARNQRKLPLLSPAERNRMVLDWNRKCSYFTESQG